MQFRELKASHRARLFSALLELSDKQGSWDQALALLNQGQQVARRAHMQEVVDQFEKGQESILRQLKSTGQFLPWELSLMELGLATGNINAIFLRLREHYLIQQKFYQEFKRQLKWPLLILISVLMGVLVWAHVDQELGLLSVAIRLLFSIGFVYVSVLVVRSFCQLYRVGILPSWFQFLFKAIPGLSDFMRSEQTYHYLKNLQQCTESGLPLQQSLKLSAKKIPDPLFVQWFMPVHNAVQSGGKLSAALASCGILNGIALGPIKKANASAADAQQHISDAAFESYIERLWVCARWLPQALYAMLPFLALINLLTI
jgi:type II secretory pathway component PulF